jgi:hypothetical protein
MRDKIPPGWGFHMEHPNVICELSVAADRVGRDLSAIVEDGCLDLGRR